MGKGMAPAGDNTPSPDATAPYAPAAPGSSRASHRATRSRPRSRPRSRIDDEPAVTGVLAWVPYLVVLAGAGAGMFVVAQGSAVAIRGMAVLGGTLLAAALTRLLLPNRFAGVLASRRKASDVLAFAVFGAAVLAVALSLP
jgi:hypothetical protein